jgi:hypothetical protein
MSTKRLILVTVVLVHFFCIGRPATGARAFEVFDGTSYAGKPDMSAHGLKPVYIIYAGSFWPGGKQMHRLPLKETVLKMATEADRRGVLTVLDIEQWPLSRVTPSQAELNLSMYRTILEWFRDGAPRLQVGYYGHMPMGDYWRAIRGPADRGYKAWQQENDRTESLAQNVDALFPSLYTAKPDQEGWVKVAVENIKEARRLGKGKPVYVFLWPLYDNNPATEKNMIHTYIGSAFWTLQLETAKAHADGAIIWGGWDFQKDRSMIWDENAPWWKDTKKFMKSLDPSAPSAPTSINVN